MLVHQQEVLLSVVIFGASHVYAYDVGINQMVDYLKKINVLL